MMILGLWQDASSGPEGFPLGVLLAAQPGLPTEARDALWRAGLLDKWRDDWPAPQPPSDELFDELAARATGGVARALAAAATDPARLDRLVRSSRDKRVAAAAAANPYLDASTTREIAGRRDSAETVSDRVTAQQLLADHVATNATDAVHVARSLVEAREAVVCADVLTSRHYGIANAGEASVAEALLDELVGAGAGSEHDTARLVRGAVLVLLEQRLPEAWLDMGERIARTPGAAIDPGALAAVSAAIDAGRLAVGDVVARLDADAATYAEFLSPTAAALVPPPERHKVVAPEPRDRRWKERAASVKLEAQALALLGHGDAGARAVLVSREEIDDDEVDRMLDGAGIDTILDWAEGRLPHRPNEGDVVERIRRMSADEFAELADEVDRRPDSLERCAELALCLPGAASKPVARSAARPIRAHLQRALGANGAAWEHVAAHIARGTKTSLLDLTADAARTLR